MFQISLFLGLFSFTILNVYNIKSMKNVWIIIIDYDYVLPEINFRIDWQKPHCQCGAWRNKKKKK